MRDFFPFPHKFQRVQCWQLNLFIFWFFIDDKLKKTTKQNTVGGSDQEYKIDIMMYPDYSPNWDQNRKNRTPFRPDLLKIIISKKGTINFSLQSKNFEKEMIS